MIHSLFPTKSNFLAWLMTTHIEFKSQRMLKQTLIILSVIVTADKFPDRYLDDKLTEVIFNYF